MWKRPGQANHGTGTVGWKVGPVLGNFYFSTNGDDWTNNDGWNVCCDLGSWHGVEVDDSGRVARTVRGAPLPAPRRPDPRGDPATLRARRRG